MPDDVAVGVSNPLHLLLAARASRTHLAEVAVLAVTAVLLLLLLALVENAAVGAVVRLARPVRAVGVSAPAPHVPSSAGAHDAVVAVRASGVFAISAPAPTAGLALAVLAAVVRLLGAVRAVGALPLTFDVPRAASRHEAPVAVVAVAAFPSLAALERLLSFLAPRPPPRHPVLVVGAIVRVLGAVRAVAAFAPPFHVPRAAGAHETAVAEVAVAARVALALRHRLLALLASLLAPLLTVAVLTAVVRVLGAVRAVRTLTSTLHVTCAALRHETSIAEVAVASGVAFTLRRQALVLHASMQDECSAFRFSVKHLQSIS